MAQATHAEIITLEEVRTIRRSLPRSWTDVVGILKGKRIDPLRYQAQIRKGWTKRTAKLHRQLTHGN